MDLEWSTLLRLQAFDPAKMREKEEVMKNVPNAKFGKLRFVVGQKGIENGPSSYYKARLIVQGHNIRDIFGTLVAETLVHVVPSGLLSIRIVFFWAGCFVGGLVLTGDPENA